MFRRFVVISCFSIVILLAGCDNTSLDKTASSDDATSLSQADRENVMEAFAEAQERAEDTIPPPARVVLPTLDGWVHSDQRALPPEDDGFSVAYQHESGRTVTVYQFTRRLTVIPAAVEDPVVAEEMEQAKAAIEQIRQLGIWESAEEKQSGVVSLGESDQQALWSRFELVVGGAKQTSDIYVWSRDNTFFKVRCTCSAEEAAASDAAMQQLLTALGSSPADE